ncbi:variant 2, CCR4-NOT core ubiquitin-protein ligase subunit mot2, partial [Lathyrus oleraceus]
YCCSMKVSVSVGVMNFVGCWFGAMPCCHGAGGLAGQYRFGGRSGASIVFLGIGKLLIALVFGNSFGRILAVSLTGSSAALGFFVGIVLYMLLKLRELDCGFGFLSSSNKAKSSKEEEAHLIA